MVPKNHVFPSLFTLKMTIFPHDNAKQVHQVAASLLKPLFLRLAPLKEGSEPSKAPNSPRTMQTVPKNHDFFVIFYPHHGDFSP